jgi:hypothetical protein
MESIVNDSFSEVWWHIEVISWSSSFGLWTCQTTGDHLKPVYWHCWGTVLLRMCTFLSHVHGLLLLHYFIVSKWSDSRICWYQMKNLNMNILCIISPGGLSLLLHLFLPGVHISWNQQDHRFKGL